MFELAKNLSKPAESEKEEAQTEIDMEFDKFCDEEIQSKDLNPQTARELYLEAQNSRISKAVSSMDFSPRSFPSR